MPFSGGNGERNTAGSSDQHVQMQDRTDGSAPARHQKTEPVVAESTTHMRIALSSESEATTCVVETEMSELRTQRAEGVARRSAAAALTPGDVRRVIVAQIIRSARSHTCENIFFRPM